MVWLMLRRALPSAAQRGLLEAALAAGVDRGSRVPSIVISRMVLTCGLALHGAMASGINVCSMMSTAGPDNNAWS